MLIYGSHLLIDKTVELAQIFNISERVIGLSLVAIGTSLPELIICIAGKCKINVTNGKNKKSYLNIINKIEKM